MQLHNVLDRCQPYLGEHEERTLRLAGRIPSFCELSWSTETDPRIPEVKHVKIKLDGPRTDLPAACAANHSPPPVFSTLELEQTVDSVVLGEQDWRCLRMLARLATRLILRNVKLPPDFLSSLPCSRVALHNVRYTATPAPLTGRISSMAITRDLQSELRRPGETFQPMPTHEMLDRLKVREVYVGIRGIDGSVGGRTVCFPYSLADSAPALNNIPPPMDGVPLARLDIALNNNEGHRDGHATATPVSDAWINHLPVADDVQILVADIPAANPDHAWLVKGLRIHAYPKGLVSTRYVLVVTGDSHADWQTTRNNLADFFARALVACGNVPRSQTPHIVVDLRNVVELHDRRDVLQTSIDALQARYEQVWEPTWNPTNRDYDWFKTTYGEVWGPALFATYIQQEPNERLQTWTRNGAFRCIPPK